jgi:hypothetical protein
VTVMASSGRTDGCGPDNLEAYLGLVR